MIKVPNRNNYLIILRNSVTESFQHFMNVFSISKKFLNNQILVNFFKLFLDISQIISKNS